MKLYIPEIGDSITLIKPWTFDLYNEYRNDTLREIAGDTRKTESWGDYYNAIPFTIPEGAVLKVDRIYIRKGVSEYSSVTFLWKGKSTEPRVEQYSWNGMDHKIPRKPVRFWAKLSDVNNIEFQL